MQSTNARPIEELTTKTDAFFQALLFSDKYKTVNTQIRAVFLGFLFRVRQKNKSFVLGVSCGWFPFNTFYTPIQVGTYRQPLPNIFVWEKSAEACTTKNREISNMRRLYCLDALAARQTLYKLASRRKKCIAWL